MIAIKDVSVTAISGKDQLEELAKTAVNGLFPLLAQEGKNFDVLFFYGAMNIPRQILTSNTVGYKIQCILVSNELMLHFFSLLINKTMLEN